MARIIYLLFISALLLTFASKSFALKPRTKFNIDYEVKKAVDYIDKGNISKGCGKIALIYKILEKENKVTTSSKFSLAMCHQKQGDYASAIKYFEELVEENPSLVRVKLELGLSYFQNKQYGKSKKIFEEILQQDNLPPHVVKNVKFFLGKIDSQKSWGGRVSVGYLNDTNINVGTDSETVSFNDIPLTLSQSSKPKRDYAYKTDLSLYKTFIINRVADFTINGGYNSVNYQDYDDNKSVDGDDYDLVVQSISGNLNLDFGRSYSSFGSSYVRIELGDKKIVDIYDVNTNLFYAINKSFAPEITLGHKLFDYPNQNIGEGGSNYLSLGLKYNKFTSGNQFSYYILPYYYFEQYNLKEEYISYKSHKYGLRYLHLLPYSLVFFADISKEFNKYFEDDIGFGEKRDSDRITITSSLSKSIKKVKGLSVNLSHTYSDQKSKISLYEYDKHQYTISLSYSF